MVSFSLILVTAGCSVEKNTASSRFYHSLTSRYNIYFNGKESYEKGVEKVNNGYRDDYSELLNIFEFTDPSTPSMCTAEMERAIQKASKLISLKSITSKPEGKSNALPNEKDEEFNNRKEYNEWVDDAYLLIGKARIYKREFALAASTLNFTINSSSDIKIRNESAIWLARALNESSNFGESARILNELDLQTGFDDVLKGTYYSTMADLFLKQKKYAEAVKPLEESVRYLPGKRNRYRLTYLLAQVCEKTGDDARATALFRAVTNMNPPYEVEFNARINLADVFDISTGNPEEIKKELEKMLKDSKNSEYRDQIWYALGNLAKREGNMQEAIHCYERSAAESTINTNQKGKSYLAIAEFMYELRDYVNSGLYYDSSIYFLDKKYPDYSDILAQSTNLNLLVTQIRIIEREDSLQRVARMSEPERNALIASIIEQEKKDEASLQQSGATNDMYNLGQYYENEQRNRSNITQEGKWYFYNQTALTFGRTEFRRRWGDRKLEDNWRRINRARVSQSQSDQSQDEATINAGDSAFSVNGARSAESYLRNLPLNDSLLRISDERIATALLEAGKIYYEKFSEAEKAVSSFEELISRYPRCELEPETMYNIYKVYKDKNDQRSEIYRQKLLTSWPENDFSRILSDPDYYNKKLEQIRAAENLYNSAYEAYVNENFAASVTMCDDGLVRFGQDELAPKFQLLRSLSIGRISDERTFKEELAVVQKKWAGTEEATRATEIINWLNQEIPELKVEEDKQIAQEIYIEEMSSQHVFIIIVSDPAFNINQASFDIISYNIDNYTNKNFRTQGTLVDNKYVMFTVSGFGNTADAMEYYSTFRASQVIRNPTGSPMMTFIIGKSNLEALNADKNPERYRLFFVEKYLNGGKK